MIAAFAREGGYGIPASVIHADPATPDHIIVPDAALLFTADFHRAGPDLILTGHDGRHHIIPGYFTSEHRAALAAPNGARLSPDLIDLLAGSPTPNEYAQAGAVTPADPIGQVEKVVGTVAVMRNGVAVTLNVGDKVYKSDVIQTGADAQVGISFPDGTALNLTANTRMALNDYTFDPNAASGNGALISLVEGSFSFVAGKVAHTGDMKIDTPVATMGIRGTTGWASQSPDSHDVATITANAGEGTFTFAVAPDYGTGLSGYYDLVAHILDPVTGAIKDVVVATVAQPGFVTTLVGNGVNAAPNVTVLPANIEQQQFGATAINQVIQVLTSPSNPAAPAPITPPAPTPTPGPSPGGSGSGGAPQDLSTTGNTAPPSPPPPPSNPVTLPPSPPPPPPTLSPPPPPPPPPPSGPPPTPLTDNWIGGNGNWNVAANWSGGVPGSQTTAVIAPTSPVTVTVDGVGGPAFAAALGLGAGDILQIANNPGGGSSSLTVSGPADIAGLVQANSNVTDPTLSFIGGSTVTVESTGTIEAQGSAAVVDFIADTLVNHGTILADQNGTVSFILTGVGNFNAMTATSGGAITISDGSLNNTSTITADGGDFTIDTSQMMNNGMMIAKNSGVLFFKNSFGTFQNTGTIEAGSGGGSVEFINADLNNAGGTLVTVDSGATIYLFNSAISGGAINNAGLLDIETSSALEGNVTVTGGQITIESGETLTLDDVTLDNVAIADNGTFQIDAGQTLTWLGSNTINGTAVSGDLIFDNDGHIIYTGNVVHDFSTVTFEGSGTVTRAGGGQSSTASSITLTNEGNTFDGFGTQGGPTQTLINETPGTFDADVANSTYALDFQTITNAGTFEATNGATLEIENSTVNNTGGTVQAAAGAEVLLSNATINHGTVSTAAASGLLAAGVFLATGTSKIENATINNSGFLKTGGALTLDNDTVHGGIITGSGSGTNSIIVDNGSTLTLDSVTALGNSADGTGPVDNSGTVTLDNTLTISGATFTLELNDNGTLALNGATVKAGGLGEVLENSGNTISGAGQIGDGTDGNLTLDNAAGTIDANVAAGNLVLNTGTATIINTATLEASNNGELSVESAVNNASGTILASDGFVDFSLGVSGGSATISDGGKLEFGWTSNVATTFNGAGTLQLDNQDQPSPDFTGTISGFGTGDVIDLKELGYSASGESLTWTQTSLSGGTLTVSNGSKAESVNLAGSYTQSDFALATDTFGGTEVVSSPETLTVAVVGGAAVQEGQTLVATAVLDAADAGATVTYQWQSSSDGGVTWTDVPATTTGEFSNGLSSFYQLSEADEGHLIRDVASFTDVGGALITTNSAPTTAVADITPIVTAPFSYALDSFEVVKGSSTFDDTFTQGAPPIGGTFGSSVVAFATGGSEWSLNAGQAILSASGAAANGLNDSVGAVFLTNDQPEGTGTGQSNLGLKENATFTVSGTFDLAIPPQAGDGYGIELTNLTNDLSSATEAVQLVVERTNGGGGATVELVQVDHATDTFTPLDSYVLTAPELADTQIELELAHTAGSSTITASFELIGSSAQSETFTPGTAAHAFSSQTFTRAEVLAFAAATVTIGGTAQQGQMLTANAATNDADATINYQWEESTGATFDSFTDIGTNSATYTAQSGDVGDYIRVVATTSDPDNPQSATATSAATGPVAAEGAQTEQWINTAGGTWTDAAHASTNWSDGALPRSVDNVAIEQAGTYTVTIPNGATADAASLTLDNATATLVVDGTLTLDGALTIDAGRLIAASDNIGGVTAVTNAGTLEIATAVRLGAVANTSGTIQVDAGDTLTLTGGTIAGGTITGGGGAEAFHAITELSVTGLNSYSPVASSDGQFVAFFAQDGAPGDGDAGQDQSIWLYNTTTAQYTDITDAQQFPIFQAGEAFAGPSISGDGNFVEFRGDYQTDGGFQDYEYLYNRQEGTVTQIYAGGDGVPAISADGQTTAFDNGPGDGTEHILVTDQSGNVVDNISGDPNYTAPEGGAPFGNAGSVYDVSISADGQFVTFWTTAFEVVINGTTYSTGNTAGTAQVYAYSRDSGDDSHPLLLISANQGTGTPGNANSGALSLDGSNDDPAPVADNRYVVFESLASNLVSGAGDQNGFSNIFLFDGQTNTMTLVSVGLGAAANGASLRPAISADGNYVYFASDATNLVAGVTAADQTYAYNIQTGAITLVSANANGAPGDNLNDLGAAADADGSVVTFGSTADNLVTTTANTGNVNVYVVDYTAVPAGAIDVIGPTTINGNATISGAAVTVASGVTLTLDDVTVDNTTITNQSNSIVSVGAGDTVTVGGNTTLSGGDIDNSGAITANAGSTFTLSGDVTNEISAATLEAQSGGTINFTPAGGGNYGTVEADGGTITITVPGGDNGGAGNVGTIEAINNGNLTITGNTLHNPGTILAGVGGEVHLDNVTIDNAGGVITSLGAQSLVHLSGATIEGGTLSTGPVLSGPGGDTIIVDSESGTAQSALDGSTNAVTVDGNVGIAPGAQLELIGTINITDTVNSDGGIGQIGVGGGGGNGSGAAGVLIDGTVMLEDGGTLFLAATTSEPAQLIAASGGGTLDNNDFIFGSGTIGQDDSALTLTNETHGSIEAGIGTVTGGVTTGLLTIDTGSTFTNLGSLSASDSATLKIDDALSNASSINTNGGTVELLGAVTGSGSATIQGGVLEVGAADAQAVTFNGGGTLQLDHQDQSDSPNFTGTVSGFAAGDVFDLLGFDSQPQDQYTIAASYNGTDTTTLTVTDTTQSGDPPASITLAGDYSSATLASESLGWSAVSDGSGGVNVTEQAVPGTNLVQNGGFETGDLTDWTRSGNPSDDTYVGSDNPHTLGGYALDIGAVTTDADIDQQIATTPGATYQVEFWLDIPGTETSNDFSASFGGTSLSSGPHLATDGYTEYVFDVTATGFSTDLHFAGQDDGGGYFYLTDIAVLTSGPEISVPEGTQTLTAGQATAITGITLAEIGTVSGEILTVTLSDTNGELAANTSASGGGGTITNSDPQDLTITGTLSEVNSDLSTLTDTATESDAITVNATDSNAVNAVAQMIAVTVTGPPPEPPVAPDVSLSAYAPDGYASGQFVAYDTDGDSVTISPETVEGTFGEVIVSVGDGGGGNGVASYQVGFTTEQQAAVAALGTNFAVDSFTYTVTDDGGASQTTQGNIDVTVYGADYNTDTSNSPDVWTGADDAQHNGSWSDSGNWSVESPTLSDDALLNLAAGVTVTVDGINGDPHHLLEYGAGALDVGDGIALVASADSYVTNMTLEDNASFEVTNGNLYVAGTLVMDANSTILVDEGTLTIDAAAVIDVETDTSGSGGTLDGVTVTNNGNIDVASTTSGAVLTLDDGTTITGGTLTIGSHGELAIEENLTTFNSAGATLDDVTVANAGNIQVDGTLSPVTLTLTDGTTVTAADFTIGGSGVVDVESGSDHPGATLDGVSVSNSGAIEVGETSDATLALVDGAAIADGNLTIVSGSVLDVENGLAKSGGATLNTVNVTNDGTIDVDLNAASVILTIEGSTTITGGTLSISTTGEVEIASGAVIFDGVSVTDGNSLQIDHGATLTAQGTTAITGSGTVTNAGTLQATGASELSIQNMVTNTVGKVEALSGGFVDFLLGITGGSATIDGGKLEYGWSSDVNTTFDGSGTLVLDHQDQSDPNFSTASFTGTVSGFGTGDTLDVTDLPYVTGETATWTQGSGSGTLTITGGGQTASITLAGTYSQGNFALSKDNGTANPGTDVVFNNFAWGSLQYPAVVDGVHQFGVDPQYNATSGLVVLAYGETSDYTTGETSFAVTRNAESLDPFFLPGRHAPQTIEALPDTVQAPNRYNLIVPNISFSGTISPEGIYVYKGQANSDGTGANVIYQIIATPDANGDGGATFSSPTAIATGTTTAETIYNLTESFKNGNTPPSATSYDVAWDQYNSSTMSYSLELQITPINTNGLFGTPITFSPNITELNADSVTVADTALPAWHFKSAGGSGNIANLAYVLAIAETDTTTNSLLNLSVSHDAIHFQGYTATGGTNLNPSGTTGLSFLIQPNLTAYASGATNEIVQPIISGLSPYPGQGAQALQFVQVSSNNAGDYAVAWNETVTDINGTHDQVEFAVYKTSSGDDVGASQSEFQIADGQAQNIRVGEFTDPVTSSQDDVVVVYGDNTGTHILEYAVTSGGTSVALLASFTDPTTQTFDSLTVMGDGRIAITYDDLVNPSSDETSQYGINIFDLRTQGLTETLGSTQNNYIAGTHFQDTVTGASTGTVNNEYYFVGQDTTSGVGPADTFNGGGNSGWNIAIFADARSDYTIPTTATGGGPTYTTTITSNGDDPEHTGSLAVTNVQILAFDPVSDPTPHSTTIDVTGGTYVILGDYTSPVTIEAGATAELDIAVTGAISYTGAVAFEAPTGTLALDQPNEFAGTISGISGSDAIDLDGFSPGTTTAVSGSFNSVANTTSLTVTDSSDDQSIVLTLTGDYSTSTWTPSSDGHGGVDVVDPPAMNASPDTSVVSSATADGASGSVAFADANTTDSLSTNITPDGSGYVGSFTADAPAESGGNVSVGFQFVLADDQINLAPGETLTQSYNVTIADAQNPAASQSQTVSVSVGGPGNDNFVFAPGIGADTITNFNPQQDTIELDHFAAAQTVQELQSLITTDVHGDAVINLGNHDSITLAGVTAAQLTQVIQSSHVLLH